MAWRIRSGALLIALSIAAGTAAMASAESKPATAVAAAVTAKKAAPVVDQRALDILKLMSDTLKNAPAVSFQARSLEPIKAPNGMWISLFSDSHVVMQEPDKLFVEKRGDIFPLDFYFDGTTMSAYSPAKNVFARKSASGTIDDMIAKIDRSGEKAFPYADLLISDPYAQLTANLADAVYVGQSTFRGVKTDHLAFTNQAVTWQIWIAQTDHLPRLVSATYLQRSAEPTYTVEFSDWDIVTPAPAEKFTYTNTTQAAQVEFRPPAEFQKVK